MTRDSQHAFPPGSKVVLVTVPEGLAVQADTAFLAGALRAHGLRAVEVATDYCTEEDAFAARLREQAPAAVLFPYHPEFREIIRHLARVAREAVDVPVGIIGEPLLRDVERPASEGGVEVWPGDPGEAVVACLSGARPGGPRHEGVAADLGFFGGPEVLDQPFKGSLFSELGTACLWATRPGWAHLSPTAMLARLEAPAGEEPVTLDEAAALAPLEDLGEGLRRVEFWDRHAGPAVLALAKKLAPRLAVSARFMPSLAGGEEIGLLAEAGVDRVIFEVDRLAGAPPMPGSSCSVEDLEPLVPALRERGMEVGVLLVVGIPGEDSVGAASRLDALRRLRPDHLRCVAFEPTGGHAVMEFLARIGEAERWRRRWNRELHQALDGTSRGGEVFIQSWAEAHLLLAEVEVRGGGS